MKQHAHEHIKKIAGELAVTPHQVGAAITLLDDGASIPFISRYRKEATGSLDEVALTSIRDRVSQLRELDKRRVTVIDTIDKQGKLTPELKSKILAVQTMAELEDIYLPYKPKRRTRATVAKEKGLEPFAQKICEQGEFDLEEEAKNYVDAEKKVMSTDEAISGARDIIAEWVNENAEARAEIRELFFAEGYFKSKVIRGKEKEGQKFSDYFEWQESVRSIPSHRLLAVRRGEKETILSLRVFVDEEDAVCMLNRRFIKRENDASEQVRLAIIDSYKRLLSLSMETEIRLATKQEADREAIQIFSQNLRQLLMAPPLGQRRMMAIDPGYRTGCKVVCLDEQGAFLEFDTVYPFDSEYKVAEGKKIIKRMCDEHKPEVIAIGNGTASRETESFVRSAGLPKETSIVMVSESGASIYSASDVAREEFPDFDVTVRGAISIGRRLMDPLAELVKIDPKNIGVGQYQHDVDQTLLKKSLDDVVVSSVNQVGVEVNTASKQLLTYVSGVGPTRAQSILTYRNENGPFRSREEFASVPGLGPKAIEQAAGFLRIRDAANPLDASGVHPESYSVVDAMARDLDCSVEDLMKKDALRKRITLEKYVTDTIGLPTLEDIHAELAKPGRDPREPFVLFQFKEGVETIEDLRVGMKLPGVITNITAFGAFVDIGVHHDGLIHISKLSDKYIKDPSEVVSIHQRVNVTIIEIDLDRKRIALSLKD